MSIYLRAPGPSSASLLLLDVTILLPTCTQLWSLAAYECTFHLSSAWPSQGLQAGRAFLYYLRLKGTGFTAERLNVTCEAADWDALLAAGGGNAAAGGSVLSPCGTAIVTTGEQLVAALEELQPTSARTLITLAANISLPTDPTPQRQDPTPDDSQPLVHVYRNLTLVGGAQLRYAPGQGWTAADGGDRTAFTAGQGVELDLRMRRNAFNLASTAPSQQQDSQQQPQLQIAAAGPSPVMVFADLTLVNSPPGPMSSWPLGLLGMFHYYVGIDRSGASGVQVISLRSSRVGTAGEASYLGFWYRALTSLDSLERESATWARQRFGTLTFVGSEDGFQTARGTIRDATTSLEYFLLYNSSLTIAPVLSPATPTDFNLWSLEPPAPPMAAPLPLSPSSFAIATNASELLKLLQATWSGTGPRVIMVVNNISLQSGASWPQTGAKLSYNVTLLGPYAGPPVWLDMAGLPLVGMAGVGTGGVGGSGGGDSSLSFQLHRIQLLEPPPLIVDPVEVAAATAQGALEGLPELNSWGDRCLQQESQVPVQERPTDGNGSAVRTELRNCSLGLPPVVVEVLRLSFSDSACDPYRGTAGAADPTAPAEAWAQRLCALLLGAGDRRSALQALVTSTLGLTGQASLVSDNAANTTRIFLSAERLGGITFLNSTFYAAASSGTAAVTGTGVTGGNPPCGFAALLAALVALPFESFSSSEGSANAATGQAVVIGAAVGGTLGGVLLLLAAVVFWVRYTRQRNLPYREVAAAKQLNARPGQAPGVLEAVGAGRSSGEGRHVTASSTAGAKSPGPAEAEAVPAGGAAASTYIMQQASYSGHLTFSRNPETNENLMIQNAGESAGRKAATMADDFLLGSRRGQGAAAALVKGEAGGQAAPGSTLADEPRPARTNLELLGTLKSDIEHMFRRCQLATEAVCADSTSTENIRSRQRRVPLLGRGGYGAVFLDEWRGLPAAIKVVLLGLSESPTRQERLTREVALTMALAHPNIVPTYHHSINVMRSEGPATGNRLEGAFPGSDGRTSEAEPEFRALELRLVMQYCEGGTLGSSLQGGKFRDAVDLTQTWSSATSPCRRAGAPASVRPSFFSPAVGETANAEPDEARQRAHGAPRQQEQGHAANAPEVECAPEWMQQLLAPGAPHLSWRDIKPAGNMPLSLLAALDVARGLEYLHAANIIHGDLTENNVLLKAVVPVLPQPPPRPAGRASSAGSGPGAQGTKTVCGSTGSFRRLLGNTGSTALTSSRSAGCGTLGSKTTSDGLTQGDAASRTPGEGAPTIRDVAAGEGSTCAHQEGREGPADNDRSQQPPVSTATNESDPPQAPALGGAARLPDVAASNGGPAGLPTLDTWQRELLPVDVQEVPALAPAAEATLLPTAAPSPGIFLEPVMVAATRRANAADPSVIDPSGTAAASPVVLLAGIGPPQLQPQPHLQSQSQPFPPSRQTPVMVKHDRRYRASTMLGLSPQAMCGHGNSRSIPVEHEAGNQVDPASPRSAAATCCSAPEIPIQSRSARSRWPPVFKVARQLLSWTFKISDFGLSVQIHDPSQSHLSNMAQGTPFFAAPEVTQFGRLSPSSDVYSFGVLLWLLLHGVSLRQIRHLLPAIPHIPVGPLLQRNASPGLPVAARVLIQQCLELQPQGRPTAGQLRAALEELLKDVTGPELSYLLLEAVRREHLAPEEAT